MIFGIEPASNPISVVDLEHVNHHEARSVIVLAPDGEDPDARTGKTYGDARPPYDAGA